jgi:hypothetical protein
VILTSGSDIGRIDTILIGSSPRLGSVTRMEDWQRQGVRSMHSTSASTRLTTSGGTCCSITSSSRSMKGVSRSVVSTGNNALRIWFLFQYALALATKRESQRGAHSHSDVSSAIANPAGTFPLTFSLSSSGSLRLAASRRCQSAQR